MIVVPTDGTTTSAGKVLGRDRAGTFLATDLSLVETAGGSPVLDADGRCVGIALTDEPAVEPDPAGAPPTANGHLRTFVVPASAVRAALPQLVELGRVRRGWLGVSLEAVTEREAGRRLVGAVGALVTEVTPGGPAATAGFRPGDQIVALSGGSAFRDGGEIVRTIASLSPGTVVQVMVTRSKTKRIEWLTATIGERPTDR
ncbi:MAG: PDZ domain-containing protein [Vicinamibacteria bacterium]